MSLSHVSQQAPQSLTIVGAAATFSASEVDMISFSKIGHQINLGIASSRAPCVSSPQHRGDFRSSLLADMKISAKK